MLAPALAACGDDAQSLVQDDPDVLAIQGGQPEPGQPAVVLLDPSDPCTATLIAPNLVLTAEHCLRDNSGEQIAVDGDPEPYYTDVKCKTYSNDRGIDLALLRLRKPVKNARTLPFNDKVPAKGSRCLAVGYGDHTADGATTRGKKRSAFSIIDSDSASGWIETKWGTGIADKHDSGGPLICNGEVVAVVHGPPAGRSAVKDRENYSRLDSAWIQEVRAALAKPGVTNLHRNCVASVNR